MTLAGVAQEEVWKTRCWKLAASEMWVRFSEETGARTWGRGRGCCITSKVQPTQPSGQHICFSGLEIFIS